MLLVFSLGYVHSVYVFRERLSICVFASFPFYFDGRMWDFKCISS